MITIALFMSIINIQNVLITLSHCMTQLIVMHLYRVVIIIILLICRTHKLNYERNLFFVIILLFLGTIHCRRKILLIFLAFII